jgi:hypothetical protein
MSKLYCLLHQSAYILSVLMMAFSCISPYEIEVLGDATAIVVDATLTNEEKAHVVKLSLAENLDSTSFRSVTGATVAILSGNERVVLQEAMAGAYVTDSTFRGIPGNSYQLEIVLSDGQRYRSTEEVMPPAIPIDSIYARYLEIPSDFNETNLNGVQIFLDAQTDLPGVFNFRYEFVESYAVDVPFPSRFDFRGTERTFEIFERDQPLERCYRKRQQSRTIVESTRNLSENRIAELPIRFINESLPDLAYSYRIGIRQYTINDGAYQFFRQLRDINESPGSLSDRQLGVLTGNISGMDDSQMPVLGYFEVAGASEIRRTFSAEQFLDQGIRTEDWVCPVDSIIGQLGCPPGGSCVFDIELPIQYIFEVEVSDIIRGDTIFSTEFIENYGEIDALMNNVCCGEEWRITDIPEGGQFIFMAHQSCSDCRIYGNYERPEVWEEL